MASYSDSAQANEEVVNAIFKAEQKFLILQHLGVHLVQSDLFLLQSLLQFFLQFPRASRVHAHTHRAQGRLSVMWIILLL